MPDVCLKLCHRGRTGGFSLALTVCVLRAIFFVHHSFLIDKNIQFVIICALRVNKCEFSVYTVRIFMKCTHVLAALKAY